MSEREIQEPVGDVAIIGMAGRFPGSRDVAAFWRNLRAGIPGIRYFTDEELLESGISPEQLADPSYVKAWGWCEDVEYFDPGFFDILPREAEATDPQIRLTLECAWEALEDAGCDPSRYPGRIGVFTGSSMNTYLWQNLVPNPQVMASLGGTQLWLANDRDFLATRVSYKLDLKGPGITVQTACSTSLVAVHLGVQSLLSGESDMVLAGGVSAPVAGKYGYPYVEGGTMSSDGHVRAFDAKAQGMLGGNGVALVVLARLEDALEQGYPIRAVIKGSALNNDGIDKVTYTAPSVEGQVQVILDALEVADVEPASISYVECHGTGTPLGDPIEISAMTQAWRTRTDERGWCPIGSVKTNIGHLDSAAGVSGLIKAVLSLQHREIPPSLDFETPNPAIDFESSPFFVNTELRAWDTDRLPRRAAVSSLGMGGTNAHTILEEAPELRPAAAARPAHLLLLSARSPAALDAATERMAQHLEGEAGAGQELADVAFTTQVGRKVFHHRRAVVGRDHADAVAALRTLDRLRSVTDAATGSDRRAAFLFSGQGAQYPNMMRGLYDREGTFRAEVDRCCELLTPHLGRDLRELLFPKAADVEAAAKELEHTRFTQPALFVVEHALARQWMEWGVEPDAMVGHSIGEYVAATLAGVFALEDALAVVAARGRLIGAQPAGGGMLAVHLPEDEVGALIGSSPRAPRSGSAGAPSPELAIAAINAPGLCVVSGPLAALEALDKVCEERGISTRRLHTSHAFHSPLMEPVLEPFAAELANVTLHAPERRFVSCSTGTWITDEEATDPQYWVRHVRRPVRFADAVATLTKDSTQLGPVLLEVGPGESLTSLARLCAERATVVPSCRHPRDERDDSAVLLVAMGGLWAAGVAIDWDAFGADEGRRRVSLPTYPFERQRLWIDAPAAGAVAASRAAARTAAGGAGPRTKPELADWFYVPSWRQSALAPPSPESISSSWLLFADEGGLAAELAARLRADGRTVVTVRAGAAGERIARAPDDAYTIDPRRPEDYEALFAALREHGELPREIVHLPGVDPIAGDRTDTGVQEAIQERGFFGLLYLGRALAGLEIEDGVRVTAVTSGVADVLGGRPACPEKATVLGPIKSMSIELAGVSARCVDVAVDGAPAPALVDRLSAELRGHAVDPVVALHGPHRWTLSYEPVRLEEEEPGSLGLREGCVVLVTGGLGGIGLVLAEELFEAARAKLVLVGRSELPARDAWDAWLEEHEDTDAPDEPDAPDGIAEKIRAVRRLEERGAEVLVATADVADESAMAAVLRQADERFGGVHGVVHAAGVLGSGVLAMKEREQAEHVLAPKVRGTQVLERLFAGRELDFLLFCSSISTATPIPAGVDYAAANGYLDAFAQHHDRRDSQRRVISIDWDTWAEVGMVRRIEVPEAMRERQRQALALAVTPAEGRAALRRVLASGLTQVYVTALDLRDIGAQAARVGVGVEAAVVPGEAAGEAAGEAHGESAVAAAAAPARRLLARPAVSTELLEPRTETEGTIAELWADLLGIECVGVEDSFFELGGNSLVMMQMNVRLRSLYGIAIPVRELFEAPTVAALAEKIDAIRAVSDVGDDGVAEEEIEEFTL